ncbi:hypothetical protein AAVH_02581 [Aphelenchoides avenae]|nr:hypothetical protein AAVH_02581 [Aphelenchus avenae]
MANLDATQRAKITFVEQYFDQNQLWWSDEHKSKILIRMASYYDALNVTRRYAQQLAAVDTAARTGTIKEWTIKELPETDKAEIMTLIFSNNHQWNLSELDDQ